MFNGFFLKTSSLKYYHFLHNFIEEVYHFNNWTKLLAPLILSIFPLIRQDIQHFERPR